MVLWVFDCLLFIINNFVSKSCCTKCPICHKLKDFTVKSHRIIDFLSFNKWSTRKNRVWKSSLKVPSVNPTYHTMNHVVASRCNLLVAHVLYRTVLGLPSNTRSSLSFRVHRTVCKIVTLEGRCLGKIYHSDSKWIFKLKDTVSKI